MRSCHCWIPYDAVQLNDKSNDRLPVPEKASLEHSRQVADHLKALIRQGGGSISFGEFMQHALYAPGLGYYAAGTQKFGGDGDFVTAPERSAIFGNVLARQIAPLLTQLDRGDVLELGPGSGALPVQLLRKLEELGALPSTYQILEVSADLSERQQRHVAAELPHLFSRVKWIDCLPESFNGVVVANEVADALPVERFARTRTGVDQLRVTADGDEFRWCRSDAPEWLAAAVARIEADVGHRLPEGYVSELSPGLRGWIDDLAGCLAAGYLFLFDYGVARHEYYAADRNGGWLRCHFRHRAHNDALIWPGIQDLTAWVDFTGVAEAGTEAGLKLEAWVSQAHFLMHGGLSEELAGLEHADAATRLQLSSEVKLLTLPGEMGENFKCMVFSRGNVAALDRLAAADRSHAL